MRSQKSRTGVLLAIAATMMLAGCQVGGTPDDTTSSGDMEPKTLVVAAHFPENNALGSALSRVLAQITERSDEELNFEVYWSGSLFAPTDAFQNIGAGTADIGVSSATYWPAELMYTNLLNQTVFQAATSHPYGFLQENAALNEMVLTSQVLKDEWARGNQLALGATGIPHSGLACVDGFDFDGAAGKSARVGGPIWGDEIAAFGMTGVSMAFSEIYDAMQRGVVDCATVSITSLVQVGMVPDLVKFYTPVRLSGDTGNTWSINLDTFGSLPSAMQEIIRDEFSRLWVYNAEGILDETAQAAESLTILDASEYNSVMEAYHEGFLGDLAADADADAQSVIADFGALLDKWDALVAESGFEEVADDPETIRQSFINGRDSDLSTFVDRFDEEVDR